MVYCRVKDAFLRKTFFDLSPIMSNGRTTEMAIMAAPTNQPASEKVDPSANRDVIGLLGDTAAKKSEG